MLKKVVFHSRHSVPFMVVLTLLPSIFRIWSRLVWKVISKLVSWLRASTKADPLLFFVSMLCWTILPSVLA